MKEIRYGSLNPGPVLKTCPTLQPSSVLFPGHPSAFFPTVLPHQSLLASLSFHFLRASPKVLYRNRSAPSGAWGGGEHPRYDVLIQCGSRVLPYPPLSLVVEIKIRPHAPPGRREPSVRFPRPSIPSKRPIPCPVKTILFWTSPSRTCVSSVASRS